MDRLTPRTALPSPALTDIAGEVVARCRAAGNRAVTIAIDGVDGVGKTTFADALAGLVRAAGVRAHRVSIDRFHHQREHRYRRGRRDPVGYFEDSFDHAAFVRLVLDPLAAGTPAVIRPGSHDLASDRLVDGEPVRVEAGEAVLVDGVFLQVPLLRDRWDAVVFLDAPFRITVGRAIERDHAEVPGERGEAARLAAERYVPGQRLYLERCRPREHATFVVDAAVPADARVMERRAAPAAPVRR